MAYTDVTAVQSWLEQTKYNLEGILDDNLVSTAVSYVIGTIASKYATTTWADSASTPPLVCDIITMLVAAWTYERQVAEDASETAQMSWGAQLEAKANAILAGIMNGSIDLIDSSGNDVPIDTNVYGPIFFPTNSSTALTDTATVLGQYDPAITTEADRQADASPRLFTETARF